MSAKEENDVLFDGSNWQDLTRLVTRCRMKFLQTSALDADPYVNDDAKCAHLVSHFRGPALDWAGQTYEANNASFADYSGFVEATRNAFGISDEGLEAQRRGQLEGLRWSTNLPTFFAEFDRLTSLLGLNQDSTRIAILRSKLPTTVQKLLSEQALNFHNYDTMRERLLTMWSLDPNRNTVVGQGSAAAHSKRPRCGRCGKKGHTASDCRSKN